MALILPGGGVADIRGSVAGTTFSRNHYGNYMRSRTKPINPASTRQDAVRNAMSAIATAWRGTLTDDQRAAWNAYAAATSWLNALGQTIHLTGQAHFVRSSSCRYALTGAVQATSPTTPGIPAQESAWDYTADISDNQIKIAYSFPTNVNDQSYLFYVSRPQSLGRSFFAGPWQLLGVIHGNAGAPPASPLNADYPWTLGTGQKVWTYCRRIDADGRVCEPFQRSKATTA